MRNPGTPRRRPDWERHGYTRKVWLALPEAERAHCLYVEQWRAAADAQLQAWRERPASLPQAAGPQDDLAWVRRDVEIRCHDMQDALTVMLLGSSIRDA